MGHDDEHWVEWEKDCPRCGGRQWYDERHDAFFCHRDDVWLDSPCRDKTCTYCRDRPVSPGYSTDLPSQAG